MRPSRSTKMLNAVTADEATSETLVPWGTRQTVQVVASSDDAGSAVVAVEVSLDGSNWENLATVTLSPNASTDSDGFSVSTSGWQFYRHRVDSISGTNCTVTSYQASSGE
jgi:hypothetical protein